MGPCLCGDVACHSCGNPYQAEVEAAEEAAMDAIAAEKPTPEEYAMVAEIGVTVIRATRAAAERTVREIQSVQAEQSLSDSQ